MSNGGSQEDCPLCAEEIDPADKQFVPCKCGYQICVWCWHRIVDTAKKDASEGQCPACRQTYEKERIAALQAIGERIALEGFKRKTKQPKAKPKTNEVKDLTNIRVIQRKMAYVAGLPLNLADEDVLLRKEYFGQYGRVAKVSLSRTTGGAIQQFINDTCSVYITYAKEEEALRCIHSVHGFVLEGRLLRASFGTVKYCHAWLKHMPCNNPACLYLHSIGPDEDSFGKNEDAAEYTRSRVQQIVGAASNAMTRSGTVLPPPIDNVHISSSTFSDKSTARSSISDGVHGSGVGTSDMHPCKDKEGPIALPQKISSFVDIVGQSSSAASEKDGTNPEDRKIPDLCSELSSLSVGGEKHAEAPYSVPLPFKIPPSDHAVEGFVNSADKQLGGDSSLQCQIYKDTCGSSHMTSFVHPFFTPHVSEDWGGVALERKAPSMTGFTPDPRPVNNQDELDSCQETEFQDSAKSDRNSRTFSNEEIVEHLRRLDNDNLHNDDEDSVLDAVESSIISNIMSIDSDSYEDPLAMYNGLSELLGEADRVGSASWSSGTSDKLGYSYSDSDSIKSENVAAVLAGCGYTRETYAYEIQCRANWGQSLAPPRFTMPYRDPPPGIPLPSPGVQLCETNPFSITLPLLAKARQGSSFGDATNFTDPANLPSGQGGHLGDTSPFSTTLPLLSTIGEGISFGDAINFIDPANLPSGQGNQTNGFQNTMFEAKPYATPELNVLEDESKFWLLMQQSASACQDPNLSKIFAHQIPLLNRQGLAPSLAKPDGDLAKQEYANGHGSNTNGHVQHEGVSWLEEVHRNEILGAKYFSGYGRDIMSNV
ncbi:RING-type E3 ubiquitin transferase [Salvia divinorum]|uniref:RING-type E3 ubiquitin transferase n=1 Tax=Salvia divinorum TaxID=28513 RepID=A0ABD1H6K4_SALDI